MEFSRHPDPVVDPSIGLGDQVDQTDWTELANPDSLEVRSA